MSVRVFVVALLALVTLAVLALQEDPHPAADHQPPRALAAGDLVTRVNERLQTLPPPSTPDSGRGHLDAVLGALEIPVESQVLVFSRTSRQRELIGESNPRAIYFNDRAAVGFVPGADDLEITLFDSAKAAARFYTLPQARGAAAPRLLEGTRCFECHTLPETGGLQGLLMRSVASAPAEAHTLAAPAEAGAHVLAERVLPDVIRTRPLDDTTRFALRWNGWFVTGERVPGGHLGRTPSLAAGVYPVATSDVAALLVLGHQVEMTNRLLRLADAWSMRERSGDTNETRVRALVDEVVRYMVFADEAPLPAPARGDAAFAKAFAAARRRDARGRSLRDLDLERRLFRYPVSFMIHSPIFESLPADAQQAVYGRLSAVLRSAEYPMLSADDRRAVTEILRETTPGLPGDF